MQDIQRLESRVQDIMVMLGQSSLIGAQPLLLHGPSRRDALDEHPPAQPQELYAMHSYAASSSSRQPFTTLRTDNHVLSDLALDFARNLDQLDSPRSDTSSSFFDDFPLLRHHLQPDRQKTAVLKTMVLMP